MDATHDLHAADNAAEGGESLAVGVPGPSEVERRLVADADEELVAGRVVNQITVDYSPRTISNSTLGKSPENFGRAVS